MTKKAHTAKPWKVYKDGKGFLVGSITTEELICKIPRWWTGQKKQNADLIAASGDLLDAAKAAIEWWHSDARRMLRKEPAWVQSARDAIKAAEEGRAA